MVWTSLANTTVKMGEFGVAKSTGKQGRMEKEKKKKEQNWVPQGSQTPSLVHFEVQLLLVITHLPMLTPCCLEKAEKVEIWTVKVLLLSCISLSQDVCLLCDGLM